MFVVSYRVSYNPDVFSHFPMKTVSDFGCRPWILYSLTFFMDGLFKVEILSNLCWRMWEKYANHLNKLYTFKLFAIFFSCSNCYPTYTTINNDRLDKNSICYIYLIAVLLINHYAENQFTAKYSISLTYLEH